MKAHIRHPRDPWFHARLLGAAITALVAMGSAAIHGGDDPAAIAQASVQRAAPVGTADPSRAALRLAGAGGQTGRGRP